MSRPSKIAIVKELGARSPRCLAAHAVRGNDEPELVVVERYPAALGPDVLDVLEEDTRELALLEHANVATLIASVKLKGDIAVLSEWVDGESLESILASTHKPPFDVLLRIVTGVLDGISALHALGKGRVCGSLGSDDVFVGVDGVTRIARFGLGRIPPGALALRRVASMSPEFLRGQRSARGDVFSAGTLLWECFMGERLFATPTSLEAHRERLTKKAPRVDVSRREPWASGLADVIERALAIDPAARWASPSDLSRAIASVAGSKIASRPTVSQYIARVFGEHIQARVAKLEPKANASLLPTTPPPAEAKLAHKSYEAMLATKPAQPAAKRAEPTKPVETPKPGEVAKPSEIAKSPAKPPEPAKPIDDHGESVGGLSARRPIAQKSVPLPKRLPSQPDASPRLAETPASSPETADAKAGTLPKTNGSALRALTSAKPTTAIDDHGENVGVPSARRPIAPKKIIAPLPKLRPSDAQRVEPKHAPAAKPDPAPVAATVSEPAPQSAEPAPQSVREELDVDVDLVSVRPPPVAPAVEEPPRPEPPPAVAAEIPSTPKLAPAFAAPSAAAEDENLYARRSPYRGPLLVLSGIVLLGAGFAAGRLTAPEPWPALPASATVATASAAVSVTAVPALPTSDTASAAVTASAAPGAARSPNAALDPSAAPSPSAAASEATSPTESAESPGATGTATPWPSPRPSGVASSRHYDPNGI